MIFRAVWFLISFLLEIVMTVVVKLMRLNLLNNYYNHLGFENVKNLKTSNMRLHILLN